MKLSTKEVYLLCRMASKVRDGNPTTHRSWFNKQCKDIGLNTEKTIEKLACNKLIKRSSSSSFWPVTINIYKD